MSAQKLYKELEAEIQASYEEGVTLEAAERLAGKFLYAQIQLSATLRGADLDARMRKSGLKAVRAAVYSDIVGRSEKKPTVDALEHMLNSNELVNGEQVELDKAEVERDELERLYDIFLNAHIYFRGVAKGRFD